MRRALLLIAMMSLLAVVLTAQQAVVQSPNGGEVWKKGEFRQIKFASDQTSGSASLVLVRVAAGLPTAPVNRTGFQEIGQIGSVMLYPNAPSYNLSWEVGRLPHGVASPGSGYKILVKIATPSTTVTDVSDSPFVIGAPPTVDYFAINDGLAVTNQRKVTLNYRFAGFPVPVSYQVKCTPTPGTVGPWTPMPVGVWPTYELPQQPGEYRIELWLANDLGSGPSKIDAIRYELPPPPFKDFSVNPSQLICVGVPEFRSPDWTFRCTSSTFPPGPTAVTCDLRDGSVHIEINGFRLGNKLEYEFFVGRQLNPGWSFVSLAYSDALCKDHAGSAVLIMPQPGSRDIKFKVRVWTEGLPFIGSCTFLIKNLIIRGPADRPVSEAFK